MLRIRRVIRHVVVLLALIVTPVARASAQNLTVNPFFNGGTAFPWTGTFGFDGTVDSGGVPGSGSGRASIVSSNGGSALIGGPTQCFPTSPGATYTASENVFISSVNAPPDVAILVLGWYTSVNCTFASFIQNTFVQTNTANAWVPLSLNNVVPPAGANSVLVGGELEWFADGTHTANFDDILLNQIGGVFVPVLPPVALAGLTLLLMAVATFAMVRRGARLTAGTLRG